MAFVASSVAIFKYRSNVPSSLHSLNRPTCFVPSRVNLNFSSSKWRMVSSPDPASSSTTQQTSESSPAFSNSTSQTDVENPIDIDKLVARAKDVATDVSDRPGYYSKIGGYLVGGVILLTIVRAVVTAIDSLPILPSSLELIGLGYSCWFVWRYVLFRESRAELLEEIDDFLGRTRPGGKKD